MFEPLERMPEAEIARRWRLVRELLVRHAPEASGLMAFSRLSLYYLTGTMNRGVFWLPQAGEPVLFLRRGLERAALESPLSRVVQFRSYRDLPGLAAEHGVPLGATLAVEMAGLPWSMGQTLSSHLPGTAFVSGDLTLLKAQSFKSDWELGKMRLCGARHHQALHEIMPARLKPGLSEREISHQVWEVFFSLGHMGLMRMGSFGEEIFLGHVSAGDSANYPSAFDGPLGLRGEHPAVPFMGYAGKVWRKGEVLALDVGFALEGYNTDKTQIYWPGKPGSIPKEVAAAHDFCVAVQAMLAENLRPGAVPSELYARAMDMYAASGLGPGFMALPPNTVRFVGHSIGLVIDGWPVIAKGFDEPLEAGQTFALEPKFGLAGVGMVGVENTFEVTPAGGVCLTGNEYDIVCLG
jgi:Xaa-Pro aminopeptidase